MGVACLGGRLYAVGGHDGTQHLNTVECYNPKVINKIIFIVIITVICFFCV